MATHYVARLIADFTNGIGQQEAEQSDHCR
jgi:hypothetical protein